MDKVQLGFTTRAEDNHFIVTFHAKGKYSHIKTEEAIPINELTMGKLEQAFIYTLEATLDGRDILIGETEEYDTIVETKQLENS